MFHELAEGKLRMKRALGPIQPITDLEKPLAAVDAGTLAKVEEVWSG